MAECNGCQALTYRYKFVEVLDMLNHDTMCATGGVPHLVVQLRLDVI